MYKIIIFGGTFDPIHNGHIFLAEQCQKIIGADKVIFVPTNIPPHKDVPSNSAMALHRFNMCKTAIGEYRNFEASRVEIFSSDVSYTFNTIEHFHQEFPEYQIFLLMGADMFVTLLDWKNSDIILKYSSICVAPRNSENTASLENYKKKVEEHHGKVEILNIKSTDVSSTMIRDIISNGGDISKLVPINTLKYIEKHKLYIISKEGIIYD